MEYVMLFEEYDFLDESYSKEERKAFAKKGWAMENGSYPIKTKEDAIKAVKSWGRGGSKPEVKAYIKRRAATLGCYKEVIPDSWN